MQTVQICMVLALACALEWLVDFRRNLDKVLALNSLSALWRLLFCVAMAVSLNAAPRINEFVAENDSGFKDEDGEVTDWIEIYNPESFTWSLNGYYLTDNATNLNK